LLGSCAHHAKPHHKPQRDSCSDRMGDLQDKFDTAIFACRNDLAACERACPALPGRPRRRR